MDERGVAGAVGRFDRHFGLDDGLRGRERRARGGGKTGSDGERHELAARDISRGLVRFFRILLLVHRCSPLESVWSGTSDFNSIFAQNLMSTASSRERGRFGVSESSCHLTAAMQSIS